MSIGEKIKQARIAKGMTQTELGHALGISGVAIMRYEKEVREPKLEMLQRIAEELDISYAYLLGWENSSGEQDMGRTAIEIADEIFADRNDIMEIIDHMEFPHPFDAETEKKIIAEYFRKTFLDFSEAKDESSRQYLHLHAARALIKLGAGKDPAMKLISSFCSLNEAGQRKAAENVEDLAKIPEYQKKIPEE